VDRRVDEDLVLALEQLAGERVDGVDVVISSPKNSMR
jgi:hypothetical protein